jgi:hypothetical protein
MEEVTFKIDMSEFARRSDLDQFATKKDLGQFATKKDLQKLDDSFHQFASMVMEAISKLATKEDIQRIELGHLARIELLEDEVTVVKNRMTVLEYKS